MGREWGLEPKSDGGGDSGGDAVEVVDEEESWSTKISSILLSSSDRLRAII